MLPLTENLFYVRKKGNPVRGALEWWVKYGKAITVYREEPEACYEAMDAAFEDGAIEATQWPTNWLERRSAVKKHQYLSDLRQLLKTEDIDRVRDTALERIANGNKRRY